MVDEQLPDDRVGHFQSFGVLGYFPVADGATDPGVDIAPVRGEKGDVFKR